MASAVSQQVTAQKQSRFCDALARCGHVQQAAKTVRCTTRSLYRARKRDPAFAAAWDAALNEAMDTLLEPEAVRRAVEGVVKPIFHLGKQVGKVREYSDTLLIFLLKGGKPAKYRERFEHTGGDGAPLIPAPVVSPDATFFAELLTLAHELGSQHGNGMPSNGHEPLD
jgi:hypothetical protein